jgi:glycosyltransferase involved in cell wall biosynthesis
MRILHISSSDTAGGAALAAYRLHAELRRQGMDSQMLVLTKTGMDAHVQQLARLGAPTVRIRRRLRRVWMQREFGAHARAWRPEYEIFNTEQSPLHAELNRQLPPCDIINLHWSAGLVDYGSFFAHVARQDVRVVWTLHDMNPMTGGCHYDWDCGRFARGCYACPQLGGAQHRDLAYRVWRRKQRIFGALPSSRLHFVTLCRWMSRQLSISSLCGRFDRNEISNGIDLGEFQALDKTCCKIALGLDPGRDVLLLVAENVMGLRKGGRLALEAIGHLKPPGRYALLTVGHVGKGFVSSIPHLPLGRVASPTILRMAYNAADALILPSLQDNLPNTAVEAIACGTPVVGFPIGGIPDIIGSGDTGVLADTVTAGSLHAAIVKVLSLPREAIRKRCVEVAAQRYDVRRQAARYVELYERLLGSEF